MLFYNTATVGGATVFGTFSRKERDERDNSRFSPFSVHWLDRTRFHNGMFSSAPLMNVTRIHVFENRAHGYCKAILLEYENGAQRAVGNCRLGVDPAKTYLNPSHICYRLGSVLSQPEKHRLLWVDTGSECAHTHDEDAQGWVCSVMEGHLKFMFAGNISRIAIVEDEDFLGPEYL